MWKVKPNNINIYPIGGNTMTSTHHVDYAEGYPWNLLSVTNYSYG